MFLFNHACKMLSKRMFLILNFLVIGSSIYSQDTGNLKLWYNQPASIWEEALPIGNGKMGAMVFGGIRTERFQLNDLTLWSGEPNEGNKPSGPETLKATREAVFQEDYAKADTLWRKMHGPYSARYLPMADLMIRMNMPDTLVTNYYRDLNISKAVATVQYRCKDIQFVRQAFISHPDKAFVVKISADKKQSVSFESWLNSKLKFHIFSQSENCLTLRGKAPRYVAFRDYEPEQVVYDKENGKGTNFEVKLLIKAFGGHVKSKNNHLLVENADSVLLFVTDATSYNGFDKSPGLGGKDPRPEADAIMKNISGKTWKQLEMAHVSDYQNLFNRVSLQFDSQPDAEALPTDDRLLRLNSGKTDNQLMALYFQFGRYLLISSSRDQDMPANLQGIWNEQVQPPWGSNYTTNINTEMNYWLAESTNLTECHTPLLTFLKSLSVTGARTAKINYGLEGWCAAHNSDIWAKSSPAGGEEWDPRGAPHWSCWPMAGAWLCQDLYRHYEYTGDQKFLKEKAWPVMKGAAQFMLGWLVKGPDGYLVTNPSTSPENDFKLNGKAYQISMATTMDMSIIRDLFNNCIQTLSILNIDPEFKEQLDQTMQRLYPFHIGQYGQLQEWFKDWDDPNDQHRHLSHLFGLYPGSQISPRRTPELAAAAKKSLLQRGDVSTGWSMAWKINWWARLEDGNHAFAILKDGLTYIGPKRETGYRGGTYPNLLDAHPPFQIDGNFGGTAGITEMLLQSYDGSISLIPALPVAWRLGEVKGLKARGGFSIDISWDKGILNHATVYSGLGGICRIRTLQPVEVKDTEFHGVNCENQNIFYHIDPEPKVIINKKQPLENLTLSRIFEIEFVTQKGKKYLLIPR